MKPASCGVIDASLAETLIARHADTTLNFFLSRMPTQSGKIRKVLKCSEKMIDKTV